VPSKLQYDRTLCTTVLLLAFFGLLMIFSVKTAETNGIGFVVRQGVAVLIGLTAMRFLMFRDYREWRNPTTVNAVVGGVIILLIVALLIGTGAETNRFIRYGPVSLQPSEFAKLALILFLAFFLEAQKGKLDNPRTLVGAILVLGVLCLLILGGKDLGTAVAVILIAASILWAAGVPTRYFAVGAALFAAFLAFAIAIAPYRVQRLLIFLDPESDPQGAGFQIIQSKIAVGSGGWFGQGLMLGRQKMRFLPEAHTDFIFGVIAEELGLIGCLAVVLAFAVILWRGLRAARRAPDDFGCYLATGATAMIVCQAMINIGVVLGMLPTKGMPLPFISYGGSSMIVSLAAAGLLLNVSQRAQ
jgi:cell division protein FtsW